MASPQVEAFLREVMDPDAVKIVEEIENEGGLFLYDNTRSDIVLALTGTDDYVWVVLYMDQMDFETSAKFDERFARS